MGEYLHNVKLGTCESLYYTTYDQLKNWQVSGKDEFLKLDSGYRFRFPFPDEKNKIGDYDDYNRGWPIIIPKGIFTMNHGKKFLRTDSDLNIKNAVPMGFYVDCPTTIKAYRWSNEGNESYEIVQQKFCTDEETGDPMLQTVFRCPYCGELARANVTEAKAISDYLSEQSKQIEKHDPQKAEYLIKIAITIINGYLIKEAV